MNIVNVIETKYGANIITSFIVKTKGYKRTKGGLVINELDRNRMSEIKDFFIAKCMANNGVYKNVLKSAEKRKYKNGDYSIRIEETDRVIKSNEDIFKEDED